MHAFPARQEENGHSTVILAITASLSHEEVSQAGRGTWLLTLMPIIQGMMIDELPCVQFDSNRGHGYAPLTLLVKPRSRAPAGIGQSRSGYLGGTPLMV